MNHRKQRIARYRNLRIVCCAIMTMMLISATTPLALSQTETGQIVIKVVDPQGSVVAGAHVVVKSIETGRSFPAGSTNENGLATFPSLQPGVYEVTVDATGFAPLTQRAEV